MAIRFYDNAVTEKIKSWIKDPNLKVLGPDESTRLFQLRAEEHLDKPLTLPMIAISRDSDYQIVSTAKKALSYDGGHIAATEEKSELLNAIPIRISYQLDIYCKYFAEADEYAREFIFKLINNPNIRIELPYNDSKIVHDSSISLESTISDNSNIPERLIAGQFTRLSIRFNLDDAYLFSIPFMKNWNIEETNKIIEKEEGEI